MGRDVARVGRMRPAGGGAGASWSLALTDGTTMVMAAAAGAVADAWVSGLRALLSGGRDIHVGGAGMSVVVPTSPVSPTQPKHSPEVAFGAARTLSY